MNLKMNHMCENCNFIKYNHHIFYSIGDMIVEYYKPTSKTKPMLSPLIHLDYVSYAKITKKVKEQK